MTKVIFLVPTTNNRLPIGALVLETLAPTCAMPQGVQGMNPVLDEIIVYGFMLAALAIFCRWIWLRFLGGEKPVETRTEKKRTPVQRVILFLAGILLCLRCLQLLGSILNLAATATRPPSPPDPHNTILVSRVDMRSGYRVATVHLLAGNTNDFSIACATSRRDCGKIAVGDTYGIRKLDLTDPTNYNDTDMTLLLNGGTVVGAYYGDLKVPGGGTASFDGVQHRWKPNDEVFISGKQHAVVSKEMSAMLEFYRGAGLHADGDAQGGRRLLGQILDENRLRSVQRDAHAVVLDYATPNDALRKQYPRVPWERLVRIKMVDGEAPGLEVWTDDSEFDQK